MVYVCSCCPFSSGDKSPTPSTVSECESDDIPDIRILLLGAGESGKSTIFKQFKILYLNGYDAEERLFYKSTIFVNLMQCMYAIVRAMVDLNIEFSNEKSIDDVREFFDASQQQNYELEGDFHPKLARILHRLWNDDGIQSCIKHYTSFHMYDSTEYFMEELSRITSPNYIPTTQDILRCRKTTTAVTAIEFVYKEYRFRFIDVGGQRGERRKWAYLFDDCQAIIFCVALSEYDLPLLENQEVNRMHESLKLFESICNAKYFQNMALIVFFNKRDIFAKKITSSPLSVCFSEYDGVNEYDDALSYIRHRFLELNHSERVIYHHVTCAADTGNIRLVNETVTSIIIQDNLKNIIQ
ncbi:hypothetical protein SNEBB_005152 [Seison nebaliae]|nr:hypothetical protein SNEBB_005152 [Seison nebaliae]